MPVSYEIRAQDGLVIARYTGEVTVAQVMSCFRAFQADPGFFYGLTHLVDVAQVHSAEAGFAEIFALFSTYSRTYAAAGQGSIHLPFLLGGAVSPLTMAGSVAQGLAESLASCALTQLVRPGAPAILASFFSSMSLRSGSPTFGTPEPAIGSLVMGQLARRLNLPLRCAGNFSTSKLPDGQAMQQSMMSMMSAIQGGANYVLHSAGFLDGLLSMSYEKMVMDMDMCGALHAYLDGMEVNDDTLGFDALAELGPGQHLFSTQHTLRHYETAYWESTLNDDQPWETWSEKGAFDSALRANLQWKKTLAEYEAPAMDEGIDEALQDFVARRKGAIPDMWY